MLVNICYKKLSGASYDLLRRVNNLTTVGHFWCEFLELIYIAFIAHLCICYEDVAQLRYSHINQLHLN
jgi:hypothetical protein